MQAEASNAAEAISRTQKEKAAIMENLSTLRGTTTSLNTQLNAAKASVVSLSHKSETSASNRNE
jgi:kinesin family protein C1